jgi:hypothetical protein
VLETYHREAGAAAPPRRHRHGRHQRQRRRGRVQEAGRLHRHQDLRPAGYDATTPRRTSTTSTIPGCTTGQDVRGAAARVVRGQPGHHLRSGQRAGRGGGGRQQRRAAAWCPSTIAGKNITSLALELPIACSRGPATCGRLDHGQLRQARVLNPRAPTSAASRAAPGPRSRACPTRS